MRVSPDLISYRLQQGYILMFETVLQLEVAMHRLLTLIAAPLMTLAFTAPAARATGDSSPAVTTTGGQVRGTSRDGVQAFKGVPYAAPPTGERRFKPPQAVEPWSGVRDATRFGAACVQPHAKIVPDGTKLSEDCLTANVWSPGATTASGGRDGAKKPVMVFIHGGGFMEGTAAEPIYDGANLARKGVVVVTLQYRFGPFGYLDLSSEGDEYATSGNNGLLDQIAGLRWVRDNIAGFGGDPGNVTLFGESAGSISIFSIMGSPQADGLYHRAILQSGAAANVSDRKQAGRISQAYLELAGASTAADLRKLSAEKLQQVTNDLYDSDFSDTAFGPLVDGDVLPAHPLKRLASAGGPKVPVVITTTRDEARYWIEEVPEIESMPERLYRPWLANLVGDDHVDAAIAAYRENRPDLTEAQVGMALIGDVAFRAPSIRTAEVLARRGGPVWMGLFTTTSPKDGGKYGSPHAIDLGFVFGNFSADPDFYGSGTWRDRLSSEVQDLWTTFAKTGNPGRSDWKEYNLADRPTLVIDKKTTVENDPLGNERKVFAALPYDGTKPTLQDLAPLTYPGTPRYDPSVLAALIGPRWTSAVIAAFVALLTGTTFGVRYLLRRRRVSRAAAHAA
ncbi:carboxylesterase/lipase family protein [Streptomyces sp. NPDC097727]|uniref:carboxylesterase/lipase family protein n=1 Tax=Streptomyces sp. NPDC097727 TaxID=3366092 RepID=UPI00382D9FB4